MPRNELKHHGILGMKWGVRRFQNKNGTLTAAGRKRYGLDGLSRKNRLSNTAYKDQPVVGGGGGGSEDILKDLADCHIQKVVDTGTGYRIYYSVPGKTYNNGNFPSKFVTYEQAAALGIKSPTLPSFSTTDGMRKQIQELVDEANKYKWIGDSAQSVGDFFKSIGGAAVSGLAVTGDALGKAGSFIASESGKALDSIKGFDPGKMVDDVKKFFTYQPYTLKDEHGNVVYTEGDKRDYKYLQVIDDDATTRRKAYDRVMNQAGKVSDEYKDEMGIPYKKKNTETFGPKKPVPNTIEVSQEYKDEMGITSKKKKTETPTKKKTTSSGKVSSEYLAELEANKRKDRK